jgi:hypothetical protein
VGCWLVGIAGLGWISLHHSNKKVLAHAEQLLHEFDLINCVSSPFDVDLSVYEEIIERLDLVTNEWTPFRSRRLPVFEEIATFRDQIACSYISLHGFIFNEAMPSWKILCIYVVVTVRSRGQVDII